MEHPIFTPILNSLRPLAAPVLRVEQHGPTYAIVRYPDLATLKNQGAGKIMFTGMSKEEAEIRLAQFKAEDGDVDAIAYLFSKLHEEKLASIYESCLNGNYHDAGLWLARAIKELGE